MVNMIKQEARLARHLKNTLEDAGIEVGIDTTLTPEDFAAIKIDEYYAGLRMATPPKAVDFVVVVDCQCESFSMYILEFKNVNGPEKLNIKDIQEKFTNTIELFLKDTFSTIFLHDRFKYKRIKLYLVSDAYKVMGKYATHSEFLEFREKINKKDSLKVDMALALKLYKFKGKILNIEYDIPPNPIIERV